MDTANNVKEDTFLPAAQLANVPSVQQTPSLKMARPAVLPVQQAAAPVPVPENANNVKMGSMPRRDKAAWLVLADQSVKEGQAAVLLVHRVHTPIRLEHTAKTVRLGSSKINPVRLAVRNVLRGILHSRAKAQAVPSVHAVHSMNAKEQRIVTAVETRHLPLIPVPTLVRNVSSLPLAIHSTRKTVPPSVQPERTPPNPALPPVQPVPEHPSLNPVHRAVNRVKLAQHPTPLELAAPLLRLDKLGNELKSIYALLDIWLVEYLEARGIGLSV